MELDLAPDEIEFIINALYEATAAFPQFEYFAATLDSALTDCSEAGTKLNLNF